MYKGRKMRDNEIKCRFVYTTPDGMNFDSEIMAKHHIKVCNILNNCFFVSNPKSVYYQTIWELIKHFKISERTDLDYEDQMDDGSFMYDKLDEQFKTNMPSIEQIRELLKEK